MSTATAPAHQPATALAQSLPTRSWQALADTAAIAWRDVVRTTRQPEMLSFAVVMGVFFLLLVQLRLRRAIGAGTGVDYLQFLLPAFW